MQRTLKKMQTCKPVARANVVTRGCAARQEVVQPGGEVTDLRTEVTGVTAADLEGVMTTRDEVRAAVLDAIRRIAAAGRPVS